MIRGSQSHSEQQRHFQFGLHFEGKCTLVIATCWMFLSLCLRLVKMTKYAGSTNMTKKVQQCLRDSHLETMYVQSNEDICKKYVAWPTIK